ncbi:alpha/beta hydrolase family protein [Paenibacillus eucommiae]|uniref:Dienelactone hydrolase domain-containing protein n=1 Tax=Paenibacillus eucommiae TaxID=1355755 RepID=A0ABS4J5B1_9BACL|nr:dienelactone hydrolase family protein [Paenibacillus eucommiae]MBP1995031.1 hypothetical protein [Paenibacillus eucommiae]
MGNQEHYLYSEDISVGYTYREKQKNEFDRLIQDLREAAGVKRKLFFRPDTSSVAAYEQDSHQYREQLKGMLGWPLTTDHDVGSQQGAAASPPLAEVSFVAKDELGSIYRVEIEAGYGLTTYGVLFIPDTEGPHPLVISQHGGGGTPEICSGFYGDNNYNDMTRRVLRQGVAVFAPQLLLWTDAHGPGVDRNLYDKQLKQLGSSITAVEIYKIQRALDYLLSRPDMDASRVGMIGLSYGGFYTLFTTAVETRIKAAYSSCFINNRFVIDWPDFTWFNAGNTFLDEEVCALIAPRFLHLDVGKQDETFLYEHAKKEIEQVAELYSKLNLSERFSESAFEGGHELDPNPEGIERFCRNVKEL